MTADQTARVLAALAAPFPAEDLEWRVQSCGQPQGGKPWARVVPYVTARAIQSRLDQVVGPAAWRNELRPLDAGAGFLAGIALRLGDEWVWRWDGAGPTKVEPVKGGISDAFKRCAVLWGIGRYLYAIDQAWATLAEPRAKGAHRTKDGKIGEFWWLPPKLPPAALPSGPLLDQAAPPPPAEPKPAGPPAPNGQAVPWWRQRGKWSPAALAFGGAFDRMVEQQEGTAWPNEAEAWKVAGRVLSELNVPTPAALAKLQVLETFQRALDELRGDAHQRSGRGDLVGRVVLRVERQPGEEG